LFQQTLRLPEAQANMRSAMAMGAQTRAGEARIADLMAELSGANRTN